MLVEIGLPAGVLVFSVLLIALCSEASDDKKKKKKGSEGEEEPQPGPAVAAQEEEKDAMSDALAEISENATFLVIGTSNKTVRDQERQAAQAAPPTPAARPRDSSYSSSYTSSYYSSSSN